MERNFYGGGDDDDDGPICPSLKLVNQNFLNSGKCRKFLENSLEVPKLGRFPSLGQRSQQ